MTTDRYNILELDVATSGWDAIFDTNMEKLDDAIETIDIKEAGEALSAYEAVYIKSDGKFWLAQADGSKQPSFGIMIENAALAESKRAKTRGVITNTGWAWATVGAYIYLDPSTPGAMTQTQPDDNAEVMGIALSATSMYFQNVVVSNRPYELGGTFNGTLTSSLNMLRIPMPRGATFAADLPESVFYADISATASTTFTLEKNSTSFGTCVFLPDFTIDAAAAVDKTGGLVGIPATAHGLSVGQKIIIDNTTNYDGTYAIISQTTDEVVITATYVAETFAGTEDILMNWGFFTAASTTVFVSGDIFEIISPATADTTLADLGWVIVGSRTGV